MKKGNVSFKKEALQVRKFPPKLESKWKEDPGPFFPEGKKELVLSKSLGRSHKGGRNPMVPIMGPDNRPNSNPRTPQRAIRVMALKNCQNGKTLPPEIRDAL